MEVTDGQVLTGALVFASKWEQQLKVAGYMKVTAGQRIIFGAISKKVGIK